MLVALLWTRASSAEAPAHARVALDYAAPIELACPDRDTFAAAIATRLGYEAVVAEAPNAKTLSVRFEAHKPAVRVILRLTNTANELEAEKALVSDAGSCADLGAAAAFAAAILLDPRVMFPSPPTRAPAPAGQTLESSAPGTWPWWEPRSPIPPESPAPKSAPTPPWRWRAGLAGASCAGCAPDVDVGGVLFLGVAKGAFGIDGAARVDLPTSTSAPDGRSVRASLVLGEVFPHGRFGPLRAGVLGSAGSLLGESDGERQSSLFVATGLRVAFEWPVVAKIFLRVALDGSLVLGHVSLRALGRELWSTPAVVGGASVGAGVEF